MDAVYQTKTHLYNDGIEKIDRNYENQNKFFFEVISPISKKSHNKKTNRRKYIAMITGREVVNATLKNA